MLINTSTDVVREMLEGLVAISPDVCLLGALEHVRAVQSLVYFGGLHRSSNIFLRQKLDKKLAYI